MAKIFVSYKYRDNSVAPLLGTPNTTARQYVDELVGHLEDHEHTFKGEEDDEDISHLSEERIAQLLNDKIYDSTITLVLISKNMVENKPEKEQWISREIAYSLKENNRGGRVSHTNAMLAVVIPDENGRYDYFLQENLCCRRWPMCTTFKIIHKNMFNRREAQTRICNHGIIHTHEDPSYIHLVKWSDFINNVNLHINRALQIKEGVTNYDVTKEITEQV